MKLQMDQILLIVLSGFIFLLIYRPVKFIAHRLKLVDKPNIRKKHTGSIPLIGGLLIFISSSSSLLFLDVFTINDPYFFTYIIIGACLILMGTVDDRFDLRAIIKLIIQFIVAHIAFQNGFKVTSLYGIMGFTELNMSLSYIISILGIVGFVNAFNLMDGIDGLAGGFALISLLIFAGIAHNMVLNSLFNILLAFLMPLVIFLYFNLKKASKIFMGDAGSLFFGFIIVLSGIKLIESSANFQGSTYFFTTVLSVLALPIMDSLRVYLLRINKGKSPFKADRTHLHHLFLDSGYSPGKSAFFIITLTIISISIVVFTSNKADINWLLISMICGFLLMISILRYAAYIREWTEKIKKF